MPTHTRLLGDTDTRLLGPPNRPPDKKKKRDPFKIKGFGGDLNIRGSGGRLDIKGFGGNLDLKHGRINRPRRGRPRR